MEGHFAVRAARNGQIVHCEGGRHRGKQLHVLLSEQLRSHVQMVGRIGKVRKLKQINVLKIPSLEQFISENQKEQIEEMKYIQRKQ